MFFTFCCDHRFCTILLFCPHFWISFYREEKYISMTLIVKAPSSPVCGSSLSQDLRWWRSQSLINTHRSFQRHRSLVVLFLVVLAWCECVCDCNFSKYALVSLFLTVFKSLKLLFWFVPWTIFVIETRRLLVIVQMLFKACPTIFLIFSCNKILYPNTFSQTMYYIFS